MKIGKHTIKATHFFFDNCHKIYIIEDETDIEKFKEIGWTTHDIYPIEQIIEIYQNACPLKFIDTCKLKTIVPQCARQVTFIHNGIKTTIKN